jgi:ureidoacrylate peracid hydrolase
MLFKGQEIRPALLLIDMQNCFVSKGGSYDTLCIDTSYYLKALPNVLTLARKCREHGIPMFYTLAVREASGIDLLTRTHKFLPKSREERIESTPICVRGTWDADLIAEIKPDDLSNVITKRRDSSFYGTNLDKKLKEAKADTLILCGVDTSICVETSLRDAFNLGYDVILISDATASMDARRYECTLDDVRRFFGLVIDTNEFLSELDGK